MTTKNIQDVVAELKEQKFYQYLQVAGFHKEAEDWLTQLVKEVEAGERERVVNQVRNIVRQGRVNVFNSKESNVEWLLQSLTPHTSEEALQDNK